MIKGSPLILLCVSLFILHPDESWAESSSLPDLRSLPPIHLFLDTAEIQGTMHHVLRFSAIIENAGPGVLELRGQPAGGRTVVSQRILDDSGQIEERSVGQFVLHPAHNHWHFEQFADYELWTRAAYDAWLASGRTAGQPGWRGSKTTGQDESFCVRDSMRIRALPGVADTPAYDDCGQDIQGLSVGWADVYHFNLPEQWIDLGDTPLADGEYVLRVVADPMNLIYESPDRSDPKRESAEANEAITQLIIRDGCAEEEPITDNENESSCDERDNSGI
jgi:hypothetical protein